MAFGLSNKKGQSREQYKKEDYGNRKYNRFSWRDNEGQGSVVTVMCVSKENVNMLRFSNVYEKDPISLTNLIEENSQSGFKHY